MTILIKNKFFTTFHNAYEYRNHCYLMIMQDT